MSLFSHVLSGLRALVHKREVEQELDEEIHGYLEIAVKKKVQAGMAREEAIRAARLEMGHMEAMKEEIHNAGWESTLETIGQDIGYGLRMLRKNPGFTAVAIVTLALGIASNATIFSFVSAVMLQPPPVKHPDRVVVIYGIDSAHGGTPNLNQISAPNFFSWKAGNKVFAELAPFERFSNGISITSNGDPERVASTRVAANYFSLLGVPALLGRTFLTGDDQSGHDHVVVLSHKLWVRRFGSDRSLIGKTIGLNGEQYTVIGVMPPSFSLRSFPAQLWTPLVLDAAQQGAAMRHKRTLCVFARLKSGITVEQARANIATLAQQAQQEFPDAEKGWTAGVLALQDYMIKEFNAGSAILILLCTVGFVLMICCANIAGLLLARATVRRKEIALRMALGAGRFRIVRQLMTESLLLALLGGGIGILLSFWGADLFRSHMTFNVEVSALQISIDWRVLLLTAAIAILTAILFGLLPALQATRTDVQSTLKNDSSAVSPGKGRNRMRSILVAGEFTLAVVLLSGSGLLIKALYMEMHEYLGFDTHNLLTAQLPLPESRYKNAAMQAGFYTDLLLRVQALPGVQSAAVTNSLPAMGAEHVAFQLEGNEQTPSEKRPRAVYFVVSPQYLATMNIPLLRGRDFSSSDIVGSAKIALVNQAFVRQFLSKTDPIGQRVRIDTSDPGKGDWREIVGVVRNVKTFSLQLSDDPEIYESYLQRPASWMAVAIRTSTDPDALIPALRHVVFEMDKQLPVSNAQSMTSLLDQNAASDYFFTFMLAAFAGMAMILAAIGIYGIVAYSVGQRTREIGIRMALGARKDGILRLVITEGIRLALIGGAVGLLISLPLPRAFSSLFQGFYVDGTQIFLVVPIVITAAALLACYVPARRAVRVNPTVALRYE